jgi:hypothetical protein
MAPSPLCLLGEWYVLLPFGAVVGCGCAALKEAMLEGIIEVRPLR